MRQDAIDGNSCCDDDVDRFAQLVLMIRGVGKEVKRRQAESSVWLLPGRHHLGFRRLCKTGWMQDTFMLCIPSQKLYALIGHVTRACVIAK